MAYSNINRDKAQVNMAQRLKTAVIGVVLVVLTVSAWMNIGQQATILNEAKRRNQESQTKINKLEAANKIMKKQTEDATGSAYMEQKVREDLGLGGANDHWLIVDLEKSGTDSPTEIPDSGSEAVIKQWWDLFIKP